MFSPTQLASARLQELYRVWQDLCDDQPALPRSKLDALAFPPKLLPHLAIIDIGSDRRTFHYRLVGTGVTAIVMRDFTGETVTAFSERQNDAGIADGYYYVMVTGRPHRYEGDLHNEGRQHVTYERLALPVSNDGGRTITNILAGFHFDAPESDDDSASGL